MRPIRSNAIRQLLADIDCKKGPIKNKAVDVISECSTKLRRCCIRTEPEQQSRYSQLPENSSTTPFYIEIRNQEQACKFWRKSNSESEATKNFRKNSEAKRKRKKAKTATNSDFFFQNSEAKRNSLKRSKVFWSKITVKVDNFANLGHFKIPKALVLAC